MINIIKDYIQVFQIGDFIFICQKKDQWLTEELAILVIYLKKAIF